MNTPTSNIALSVDELNFISKAIRAMPDEDKDGEMLDILSEKFKDAARLAIIGEVMFGES